jgi:methionyl-tRNA formyltransferase
VRTVPVGLVVTQPRRRRGRRGVETPTPVAEAAAALGIRVLETPDVNAPDATGVLAAAAPRLLVVVAFGQILKRAVRETAPLGGVNLHFSLLPRWRGAAPVQRSILAGDAETGVAVQRVAARLDAGAVLASARTAIGARETTPSLMARLTETGAPLLADVVTRLLAGTSIAETAQDESLVTVAAKIGRDEGDLDFSKEGADAIDRRVRAFGDAPGCRARIERADGSSADVLVREASPEASPPAEPGRVLAASAEGIVVAARSGALRIARLQRAGGKDVDARAFLNGFPLGDGARFVRVLQRDSSATSDS